MLINFFVGFFAKTSIRRWKQKTENPGNLCRLPEPGTVLYAVLRPDERKRIPATRSESKAFANGQLDQFAPDADFDIVRELPQNGAFVFVPFLVRV